MSHNSRKKVAESKPSPECIVCHEQLGESHQAVFDEVGVELQLQELLNQCFELNVIENKSQIQSLCSECLDDLIETVDIQEKEEEDRVATTASRHDVGPSTSGSVQHQPSIPVSVADGILLEELRDDSADDGETEFKTEVLDEFSQTYQELEFEEEENDDFVGQLEEALLDDNSKDVDGDQTESTQIDPDEDDEIYENVDYLEDIDQNFDFKEYKEKCLNSRIDDIIFHADIVCQNCIQSFNKHIDLIQHIENEHCLENRTYMCGIDESCEPQHNLEDMAYHLLFKHYNLNKLLLYAQCPTCSKRFSNYLIFNKHSCYESKTLSRTTVQCEECGDIFQSNKRYRFHLQFHLDAHRPKGCLICDRMFSNENELYEHLFYKHEEDIGFTCTRCDVTYSTEENLASHQKVHEIDRPYKCQMCPKSYMYNQHLNDHVIAHHTKKKNFQCHICAKYLFKQTVLNKHLLLHEKPEEKAVFSCSQCGFVGETEKDTDTHVKTIHKNSKIELRKIDVAYCCEYCETAFNSPDALREHRNTHDGNDFYCNMCPAVYDEFKKLITHKLTHIDYIDTRKTFPVMRHYLCDVKDCSQSYLQWTTLRSHKRNKHLGKNAFTCPKCDSEFKSPIRFNQHMQTVHGGSIHMCPFCNQKYNSKMAISVHIARKHNTPKLHCDQCSSVFTNEEYLQRHFESVHRRIQCTQCGKVLKNMKCLQVHQVQVHDRKKRYFCSYCNKGYYNQCDCLEHEEAVHKKRKRFKCELCDYQAIYKQTLIIHMRAHNNETPYKCEICPKAFRRAYGLSLHMRRHFNIRNYVCPYEGCGAAYPNQGILNSHLKKKHPNGETKKFRKRRTIAIDEQPTVDEGVTKPKKLRRRKFDVPFTDVFIDDDDGLDEGVIGEPLPQNASYTSTNNEVIDQEQDDEEDVDNPDATVKLESYILNTTTNSVPNQAVIVQRNESDHDYIIKPEDSKIYGNVIEEYEVITADVVLEQ